MASKLKPAFLKPFSAYLFLFFIVLLLYTAINLFKYDVLAQEEGEKEIASTIIEKSTLLLINKGVTEILTLKDSNDNLLTETLITVTVDDSNIATISILNLTSKDLVVAEGSVVIAESGGNGQKAFLIKGVSSGSTKITFEVMNEDDSTTVAEELTVNVIDLEAIIEVDKNIGEAPLTVQFFDRSTGKIDTMIWNFGDDSEVSTEKNPEHVFADSGIFNITLDLAQITNFGTVTDAATSTVCVIPAGSTGLPGVIFGTVFDPVSNTPLNRVNVMLLTETMDFQKTTGRDGTYRFENVPPGTIIFVVCKMPFFECIREEIAFTGGPLTRNFELMRREIPE